MSSARPSNTVRSPQEDSSRARGRPRCESIDSRRSPDGGRTVEVILSWPGGSRSSGSASGVGLPEAEMRAAAKAALAAILEGAPTFTLGLRGAKAVRAFDHLVVIIAVDWEREGKRHLLMGSVAAPEKDRVRGAVLATLDAVNRVVEGRPESGEAVSSAPDAQDSTPV